jgi:hypothetical protein
MSTFIAYLLADGIVFAADRNITVSDQRGVSLYQEEAPKIFRWPTGDALVGYVGAAELDHQPMESWLPDFISRHPKVHDPGSVAHALRQEVQDCMDKAPLEALFVQFAAFAKRDEVIVPEYWHITNVHGMDEKVTGRYDPPRRDFGCSEEMGKKAATVPATDLRRVLKQYADAYDPRWFHQSIELGIFNLLEAGAKAAFNDLQKKGLLSAPQSLTDWERHARFWILQYGAYFGAFYPHNEQYVGGGADVLSIPWPTH